jgi:hypothetical protein
MNTMSMPGFTAEASFYRTSGQYQIGRQLINSSRDLTSSIYPAKLKNEEEGVDCDSCIGGQCADLRCLEKWANGGLFDPGGGGGGGGVTPCLDSHACTPCIPSGPSIFSPGRQFCIDSFCSPSFGGQCRCLVHKGFAPCRPPDPVLTTGRSLGLRA